MSSSTSRSPPTARYGGATTRSSRRTCRAFTPITGGPRGGCSRRTCAGSSTGSRWTTWWTSRRGTERVDETSDIATIADLPFHVLGRHPKPLLVGQCRQGTIAGLSTRDWFDRLRDVALGLGSLGVTSGDRVAIMSESR